MVQVVYQLFNSFGFNKEFAPLFSQIKSEKIEEKMQIPSWFEINKPELDEQVTFTIIKTIKILKLL